jgi:hypothetical protein
MCDKEHLNFQKMLHSLATRVPVIIVKRAEEMYPSLKGSWVSFLCLCAEERVFLSCLLDLHAQKTKYSSFTIFSNLQK